MIVQSAGDGKGKSFLMLHLFMSGSNVEDSLNASFDSFITSNIETFQDAWFHGKTHVRINRGGVMTACSITSRRLWLERLGISIPAGARK
jgi:hypothetical protein